MSKLKKWYNPWLRATAKRKEEPELNSVVDVRNKKPRKTGV